MDADEERIPGETSGKGAPVSANHSIFISLQKKVSRNIGTLILGGKLMLTYVLRNFFIEPDCLRLFLFIRSICNVKNKITLILFLLLQVEMTHEEAF